MCDITFGCQRETRISILPSTRDSSSGGCDARSLPAFYALLASLSLDGSRSPRVLVVASLDNRLEIRRTSCFSCASRTSIEWSEESPDLTHIMEERFGRRFLLTKRSVEMEGEEEACDHDSLGNERQRVSEGRWSIVQLFVCSNISRKRRCSRTLGERERERE